MPKVTQKPRHKRFVPILLVSLLGIFLVLYAPFYIHIPDFYKTPAVLPSNLPGTIIKTEKIDQSLISGATAWKILYVSSDFQTEKPIVVSGMVFVPSSVSVGKRPVVAWAHGTLGIATQCAPSLLPNGGASLLPGIAEFINKGYVVVATDYPGLGTSGTHPYLIGKSEAYAVLDSMRAVLNFDLANADNKFVVWGHSQGGHASLFTGQLSKDYAPEIHLIGVAATAPASDLPALFKFDANTIPGKALASLAFVAWSQLFPQAQLSRILELQAIPLAESIARRCVDNKTALYIDYPLAGLFQFGFLANSPTTTSPWKEILSTNSATGDSIQVPIIIVQGNKDTVVDAAITQKLVTSLCNQNKTITYTVLPGVGHIPAGVDSVPVVVPWVQARFEGIAATSNCSK